MSGEWTPQCHADARAWCTGGGSKSRAFAAALDQIERLQGELKEVEEWAAALDEHCACEQNQANSLARIQERLRLLRKERALWIR